MAQGRLARGWLVAFNLLSFFGWSVILTTLIKFMIVGGPQSYVSLPVEMCERLLRPLRPFRIYTFTSYKTDKSLPKVLATVLDRGATFHGYAGAIVATVQSLAVLEVVHALLGLVKTPVPTTVIQVASRLWLVWGISERYQQSSLTPWYASMVFAWSVTECVRYPFYANALMGSESPFLLWARYTLFYVLYPLGAASEAILMFKTLPSTMPWQSGVGAGASWSVENYVVLVLFILWWPGLALMYTHMMRQRRRALGSSKQSAEAKRIAAQRKRGAQAIANGSWATGEAPSISSDNSNSKKSK